MASMYCRCPFSRGAGIFHAGIELKGRVTMTEFDVREGKLACEAAHRQAAELGRTPQEVGRRSDEMGIRISHCQLGLFGYGSKQEGKHKIVKRAESVGPELEEAIRSRVREGRIPCADLWGIADALGISRLDASGAVESLGLRVSECQLGCF